MAVANYDGCLLVTALDTSLYHHIFNLLQPAELCSIAQTCRPLRTVVEQQDLWKDLHARDFARYPTLRQTPQDGDYRALYRTNYIYKRFPVCRWESCPLHEDQPRPREGHAAAALADGRVVVVGGWATEPQGDVHILGPAPPTTPPALPPTATPTLLRRHPPQTGSCRASTSASAGGPCPSDTQAAAAAAPDRDTLVWQVPQVAGQPPCPRYGHTLTRCGRNGELLLLFGGLLAGAYEHDVNTLATLQLAPPAPAPAPAPAPPRLRLPAAGPAPPSTPPAPSTSLVWHHPTISGTPPTSRGYHAAAPSEDGTKVYVFGGIHQRAACSTLTVIDVTTWHVEEPTTFGAGPCPRSSHSCAVFDNKLWVVGGSSGSDVLRNGTDLADIWFLDLTTLEWHQPPLAGAPLDPSDLGRCHSSCLVASNLLLFGGSVQLGGRLNVLDLEARAWRPPLVLGPCPRKRLSGALVWRGEELVLYGGWVYAEGELGDVHRLTIEPPPCAPPGQPPPGSDAGLPSSRKGTDNTLYEHHATMYGLMREVAQHQSRLQAPPPDLVAKMQQVMTSIHELSMRLDVDSVQLSLSDASALAAPGEPLFSTPDFSDEDSYSSGGSGSCTGGGSSSGGSPMATTEEEECDYFQGGSGRRGSAGCAGDQEGDLGDLDDPWPDRQSRRGGSAAAGAAAAGGRCGGVEGAAVGQRPAAALAGPRPPPTLQAAAARGFGAGGFPPRLTGGSSRRGVGGGQGESGRGAAAGKGPPQQQQPNQVQRQQPNQVQRQQPNQVQRLLAAVAAAAISEGAAAPTPTALTLQGIAPATTTAPLAPFPAGAPGAAPLPPPAPTSPAAQAGPLRLGKRARRPSDDSAPVGVQHLPTLRLTPPPLLAQQPPCTLPHVAHIPHPHPTLPSPKPPTGGLAPTGHAGVNPPTYPFALAPRAGHCPGPSGCPYWKIPHFHPPVQPPGVPAPPVPPNPSGLPPLPPVPPRPAPAPPASKLPRGSTPPHPSSPPSSPLELLHRSFLPPYSFTTLSPLMPPPPPAAMHPYPRQIPHPGQS